MNSPMPDKPKSLFAIKLAEADKCVTGRLGLD